MYRKNLVRTAKHEKKSYKIFVTSRIKLRDVKCIAGKGGKIQVRKDAILSSGCDVVWRHIKARLTTPTRHKSKRAAEVLE